MDALSTGGLAKLKELQKAGVVPAAFVADFTAQQQGE
jgi:tyrosyl-tRNA synthetase